MRLLVNYFHFYLTTSGNYPCSCHCINANCDHNSYNHADGNIWKQCCACHCCPIFVSEMPLRSIRNSTLSLPCSADWLETALLQCILVKGTLAWQTTSWGPLLLALLPQTIQAASYKLVKAKQRVRDRWCTRSLWQPCTCSNEWSSWSSHGAHGTPETSLQTKAHCLLQIDMSASAGALELDGKALVLSEMHLVNWAGFRFHTCRGVMLSIDHARTLDGDTSWENPSGLLPSERLPECCLLEPPSGADSIKQQCS